MFDSAIQVETIETYDEEGLIYGENMHVEYTILRYEKRSAMIFIISSLDSNRLAEIERTRQLYTKTNDCLEGQVIKVMVFAGRISKEARDAYVNHLTHILVPISFDEAHTLLSTELAIT